MQITIADETTRAALQATLWRCLSSIIEEPASHTFWDEAWECSDRLLEGNDATHDVGMFDERVAEMIACRADVDEVAGAEIGEAIELATATREIVSSAMQISVGIAEGEFWDEEPSRRVRLLTTYDALQQLVGGLTETIEAVAS